MSSYFETTNYNGQKHNRPLGPRERELLLERERERERYNRMVQGQGIYRDRRRCMALSPTRLQSRSPHLQYIHRGRANVLFATTTSPPGGNIITHSGQDDYPPQAQPVAIRPTAPIPFPPTFTSSSSSSPPSSASAISPDIEPMFQMSPVAVHCLPPLRNAEPINVMTLRNCAGPHSTHAPNASAARSRLRPGKSSRAAVPPLLYTFPRPNPNSNLNSNYLNDDNNINPKPKKENSISQLASIKKPFGLVSQNQNPKTPTEQFNSETPNIPPSLFLDLSATPHPPAPAPHAKHIRIVLPHDQPLHSHNPWTSQQPSPTKRKTRAPIPSSKLLDTPKPVLTNITVSRTTTPAILSSTTHPPTSSSPPLKRIPSLPIPIPYHTPRKEDTGLFEDSRDDDEDEDDNGNDRATDDMKLFNTAHATRKTINDDTAAIDCINDRIHVQSNCLGLGLPFSPPPPFLLPSDDTPSQIHPPPLQLHFNYPAPVPMVDSQLGLTLEESGNIDDRSGEAVKNWAERPETYLTFTTRKRRSGSKEVEITNAEYFDNSSVDPTPDPEPSSFVPAFSQRFESLEPVFPAFSIAAQDSDLNFGQGMDNSGLQFRDSVSDRGTSVNSENIFNNTDTVRVGAIAEQDCVEPNPWLTSTFSSNSTNTNTNSVSVPSPDSIRTFPQPISPTTTTTKFRNGKANLNVFNPPQMPPFGDSSSILSSSANSISAESGYGSGYNSGSSGSPGSPGSGSGSGSESESESTDQFLSFPIPIFNPDVPRAAPSAITNVLVRLPGSQSPVGGTRSRNHSHSHSRSRGRGHRRSGSGDSELPLLPTPAQKEKRTPVSSSSGSYKSSVYDGCCDTGIPQTVQDPNVSSPSSPHQWQTPGLGSFSVSPSPLPLRQAGADEMGYPTPALTRVNSPVSDYKKGERKKGRFTLGY